MAKSQPTRVRRVGVLPAVALSSASVLLGAALIGVQTAAATICGDDIGGVRVACACGDIVAGDTTLRADDPVVTTRCRLNGLVVRAPSLAENITVDLAGLSILGTSYGVGIRVESGGSEGALIIGGTGSEVGQVVGFGTGILATRKNSLRRVERVQTNGCRHHGVHIRSAGVVLVDVAAIQNGGDGLRMSGEGGRLVGVRAERNAGAGIRLKSRGALVDGRAAGNGSHGVVSDGRGNDISGVVSVDNGGHGIVVRGRHQVTKGSTSDNNARGAMRSRVSDAQP